MAIFIFPGFLALVHLNPFIVFIVAVCKINDARIKRIVVHRVVLGIMRITGKVVIYAQYRIV
jgi:hypothetical protein